MKTSLVDFILPCKSWPYHGHELHIYGRKKNTKNSMVQWWPYHMFADNTWAFRAKESWLAKSIASQAPRDAAC
jgi:hypothetical protein